MVAQFMILKPNPVDWVDDFFSAESLYNRTKRKSGSRRRIFLQQIKIKIPRDTPSPTLR